MRLPFKPSHVGAGLTAVAVGYSSAVVLIIETARVAGASPNQIISWLVMLGLGMGISGVGYSIYYRMPIVSAWSTPGAAFLIGSVQGYPLSEVLGACMLAGVFSLISVQLKPLVKLIEQIPDSLSSAMLAGILLPFCLDIFVSGTESIYVFVLFVSLYISALLLVPRFLMLLLLALALVMAWQNGNLHGISWQAPTIEWVLPTLSLNSAISLALPLFLVSTLSQNLPGIAILRAHNYRASSKTLLTGLSGLQVVFAPAGGFTFNLAAITAAICMSDDADKDPNQRYWAAIWAGIGYAALGIFAATVVTVFTSLPEYLTALLAGFALLGTLQANLQKMVVDKQQVEAALITFLCSASGINFIGVGGAVWGLLLGGLFYFTKQAIQIKKATLN